MIKTITLSNNNTIEVDGFDIYNHNTNHNHPCVMRIKNATQNEVENFISPDDLITSITETSHSENGDNTSILHKVYLELKGVELVYENNHPVNSNGEKDITRVIREKTYIITLTSVNVQHRITRLANHVGLIENPNSLNLDEFKKYYIGLSHTKLDKYLQSNPLEVRIQGRKRKSFTITKEKQKLLTNEIIMSNLAEQAGEIHKPSWNAKGEPLSNDWTTEQLLRLSFRITETVRPLVTAQQELEIKINACESIEDIQKIELDYSRYDIRKRNGKPKQRGEEGGE